MKRNMKMLSLWTGTDLIQRVSTVMPIADHLLQKCMIHEEVYSNIHTALTREEQMRELFKALNSGGIKVKSAFHSILLKTEPFLVQELGGATSTAMDHDQQTRSTAQMKMKDNSAHEDIQMFLESGYQTDTTFSEINFSALANSLLMSRCVLDEIDMRKYNISEEGV
uniref:CARD domain-containing protein n=1 Tax=Hucho hucho TaxID=62062 RepID=A0A4W5RNT1_9TELE